MIFETDEAGISWLELGFNGAAHTFIDERAYLVGRRFRWRF